jgi:hypothetical protein
MILGGPSAGARRPSDLQVWVELRGFEPLTPSMRTKRAVSRTGQVTVFAQLNGLRKDTITASEVVWLSIAAPVLLPKSDIDRRGWRQLLQQAG